MTRKTNFPASSGKNGSKGRKSIQVGILMWAKIANSPWWPAMVVSHEDCGLKPPKQSAVWVFWLGDHRVSEVLLTQLQPFAENFSKLFDKTNKGVRLNAGIHEAIKIKASRCGESDYELWNYTDSISWISSLPTHLLKSKNSGGFVDKDSQQFRLRESRSRLKYEENIELNRSAEKRRNGDDSEDEEVVNLNKKLKASLDKVDAGKEAAFKCSVIDRVKSSELEFDDICLCCVRKKTNLNHEHPFFQGKACDQCFEEIKDTVFAVGEDGVYFHCLICAQRGEVLICDNKLCRRVYCCTCIEVLCAKKARTKIADTNPWDCFLCSGYNKHLNGFLKKRNDWSAHVAKMYVVSTNREVVPKFQKRPLRVLSLFDGIGTGLCVLSKLNLELEVYYSSEIDEDAINLTVMNHGRKVTQLGNIEELTDAQLLQLAPIDLLIGGSPCNELSAVNHARKGIYSANGTGVLFFDFYRILQFFRNNNGEHHLFWLFENVASMPKEYRKVITRFFERDPIVVDAKHFSAQNRSRFFWGNIPSLRTAQQTALDIETCPELNSVLTKNCNRQAVVDKVRTITTNSNSLRQGKEASMPVLMNGKGDTLWVTEMEELFGFPRHYTDAGNLSASQRLRLLGKAWSIPVLCHILKPLTSFYSCLDSDSSTS